MSKHLQCIWKIGQGRKMNYCLQENDFKSKGSLKAKGWKNIHAMKTVFKK